jgi:hypothetical protein
LIGDVFEVDGHAVVDAADRAILIDVRIRGAGEDADLVVVAGLRFERGAADIPCSARAIRIDGARDTADGTL